MSIKRIYNVREIAHYLNLSPRRIQQLVKAGILPREGRGQYDLREVIEAHTRYLQLIIRKCKREIKRNKIIDIKLDI